jgi:hypothetical protein
MTERRRPLRAAARLGGVRRALAVVPAAGAVGLGPFLAAHDRLLLDACAPVMHLGPLGVLGTRLALLHATSDCPVGTMGVGTAGRGAVVLISVGLPVLLAHLALAVAGWSLSSLLARAVRAVGTVLTAVLAHRPGAPAPSLVTRRLLVLAPPRAPHARPAVGSLATRGPPLAA